MQKIKKTIEGITQLTDKNGTELSCSQKENK